MIIKEAKGQDLKIVGKNLSSLRSCYPGFNEWYDSKVIPKVASGERKVFLAENDGNFCGALILKNTEKEKKICTLFVTCLLYTSPSPRDRTRSRMPSSA